MSTPSRVTRATTTSVEIDLVVRDASDIDFLPHHRRRLTAAIAGATSRSGGVDRAAITTGRRPARVADTEF